MSILSQVTSGKINKPYLITLFGNSGIGKSSFAADAPNPIFACTEEGTNQLDINRFPKIDSFEKMMSAINDLIEQKHDYKTFVIDSLDHFEPLLQKYVCIKNKWGSLDEAGFGRGYNEATLLWQTFFQSINKLREKMNVILICHAQIKSFNDPSSPQNYDRYELKLHKGANALVKENCDAVLFANYENFISVDKNTKKAKGLGGENRVLLTEYRAHHDGKNRFGLPYQIELSYGAFDGAVKNSNPENPDAIASQITGLLTKVTDEALKGKAYEQFIAAQTANDVKKLVSIKNRLMQLTQE